MGQRFDAPVVQPGERDVEHLDFGLSFDPGSHIRKHGPGNGQFEDGMRFKAQDFDVVSHVFPLMRIAFYRSNAWFPKMAFARLAKALALIL
jgi:hypothetical protein